LSGFEEDICNDCVHDLEQEGLDIQEEIKKEQRKYLVRLTNNK
jgi:hypothetical protein